MTATIPSTTTNLARVGNDLYDRTVRPQLQPTDDGKFVAIDVSTAQYEIDEDDYAAVSRLRKRFPAAEIWLVRAGHPTAYTMRSAQ